MKTTSLLILALTFGLPCMAEDATPPAPPTERPVAPRMLKRFDKDGDGKLSAEERTGLDPARKSIVKHSKRGLAKKSLNDPPGTATLQVASKTRGKLAKKLLNHPGPRLLARFDADKDGRLSREEKTKALEQIKARKAAGTGPRPGNRKGIRDELRERLRTRFDTDKDGKLSDEEKNKALEQIKARQSRRLQKLKAEFDSNSSGKADETGRAKARDYKKGATGAPLRQRLMDRFDEDKDGRLNETERAKARDAWQKFRDGTGSKPAEK